MPRLELFLLLVACLHRSSTQDGIQIFGPLEGRVGDAISFSCSSTSTTVTQGLFLVYRNESAYTRPMSVSTSGNRKGFILQGVTADLNGTELACSLGEVASAFLPVLIISSPVLEGDVSSRTDTVQLREGGSMVLNTTVAGYPYPMDVNVSCVGGAVSASPSTISIVNVNRADGGICTITISNSEGMATITLNLTVYYPPTFDAVISNEFLCDTSMAVPLCSALVGSTGTLSCGFDSVPSSSLTIARPQESRATLNNVERTITVTDARVEESGTYVCTADNVEYNNSRRIDLQIGSLPAQASVLSLSISDTTVTICWNYNNAGNLISLSNFTITIQTVSGSEIVYRKTVPEAKSSHDVLRSVFTAEVRYEVTVTSNNVLGSGMGRDGLFILPLEPTTTTKGSASTLGSSVLLVICSLLISSYMSWTLSSHFNLA